MRDQEAGPCRWLARERPWPRMSRHRAAICPSAFPAPISLAARNRQSRRHLLDRAHSNPPCPRWPRFGRRPDFLGHPPPCCPWKTLPAELPRRQPMLAGSSRRRSARREQSDRQRPLAEAPPAEASVASLPLAPRQRPKGKLMVDCRPALALLVLRRPPLGLQRRQRAHLPRQVRRTRPLAVGCSQWAIYRKAPAASAARGQHSRDSRQMAPARDHCR